MIGTSGLGYPLTAYITVTVRQRELARIVEQVAEILVVVQTYGLSGEAVTSGSPMIGSNRG